MQISEELNQAINAQIGSELGASNQYLQLAGYFDGEDLPQLSGFFLRQAKEEREHAMKFVQYILKTGGKLAIPAIQQPPHEVKSAEHAAQMALDWEKTVTEQIDALHEIAASENDYAAIQFLGWFATEQLEEVSTMSQLLRMIQRAGDQLLLVESYVARGGDPRA